MSRQLTVFAFVALLCYVQAQTRVDPLVETNVGVIRGVLSDDGSYAKFLGIPYAQVNKSNPFGASLPYPKFEATYDADNDSVECPQSSRMFGNTEGEESVKSLDCLNLNVFVPSTAHSKNLLPVLVFIHGGGYSGGSGRSSMVNPSYLLKHDIVFVAMNYRLGPYGFMCLGTPEVPGNQGLKDQLSALRWISKNIQSFGGDPNKITISGQSAGAMSCDFHMHSAPPKVFSQLILESGTSLIPEAPLLPDPESAIKLAELLEHTSTDSLEALSFLASVDQASLIEASSKMDRFLPCVEVQHDNVEAFLVDFPINLDIPKAKDMKILLGHNVDEKSGSTVNEKLSWAFEFNEKDQKEMDDIVRHFYIGDETDVNKLNDFNSDIDFLHPADRTVTRYIENGASEVYFYWFTYVGSRDMRPFDTNTTERTAGHGAELQYLYGSTSDTVTDADKIMIDRMTEMWTNFVKNGNPTPSVTENLPVKWEPVVNGSSKYQLHIDSQIELVIRPLKERMSFWDLFYNRNEHLQRGYKKNDGRSRIDIANNMRSKAHTHVLHNFVVFVLATVILLKF